MNARLIYTAAAAFLVSGAIFFTVGWFSKGDGDDDDGGTSSDVTVSQETESKAAMLDFLTEDRFSAFSVSSDFASVDREAIRSNLQELASIPHLAGQDRDEQLAEWIKARWDEIGLDQVYLQQYDMLLSYPDTEKKNLIIIRNSTTGEEIYTTSFREEFEEGDLSADQEDSFIDAFLAYSPAGNYTGNIVYVNYGDLDDFELLAEEGGEYETDVTGMICMVRYGKIFRGNKVANAEAFGCKAVIIFSDPADVAPDPNNVYPDSFWLPGSGIQRGSIFLDDGDPETPSWPSLPDIYRVPRDELNLPGIIAQPIGYDDAEQILKLLVSNPVPPEWEGGLSSLGGYPLGGAFDQSVCADCEAFIEVHNYQETVTASNVVGVLEGDVEPDRYVLVGNHRDAWGFGAVDPNSGTAQMMEVARVLADKRDREGWRPRRTIIFASWAAEEYGLIGSREFVEDLLPSLSDRGVAYLNTDICVSNNISVLFPHVAPVLRTAFLDAAKAVEDPNDPSRSYYDAWLEWAQEDGLDEVPMDLPSSGSDHAAFMFLAGVPTTDVGLADDYHIFTALDDSGYPTYHTGFETIRLVEEIVDPDFRYHGMCAQMNLHLARDFSDSVLLNFTPEEYVGLMNQALVDLDDAGVLQQLDDLGVNTTTWFAMVARYEQKATEWRTRYDSLTEEASSNPLLARALNDQAMKVDRAFLLPAGLPGRPMYRHAVISTSQFNSYGAGVFPGVGDLLYGIEDIDDPDELDDRVHELNVHVALLASAIKAAADSLGDQVGPYGAV